MRAGPPHDGPSKAEVERMRPSPTADRWTQQCGRILPVVLASLFAGAVITLLLPASGLAGRSAVLMVSLIPFVLAAATGAAKTTTA
jgi:hypothetical protein